ncbi:hypothetical protein G6M89_07125 [Natronolimnobius sp. AArcel1]|uniref:hypothetical protein n=1 Tax=Natronolimnobius sp. AArcel1 TaxID=1679093 RepID=UPI0013EB714C|nr:hypothetical protein [Natronolimnobius sp. AArcel1]NGM68782.1 hypothetical protein [Natronolimnobius sp. AArcel1]
MNRRQILARSGVGLGVVTLAGCLDTLSGDSEDVEVADRTGERALSRAVGALNDTALVLYETDLEGDPDDVSFDPDEPEDLLETADDHLETAAAELDGQEADLEALETYAGVLETIVKTTDTVTDETVSDDIDSTTAALEDGDADDRADASGRIDDRRSTLEDTESALADAQGDLESLDADHLSSLAVIDLEEIEAGADELETVLDAQLALATGYDDLLAGNEDLEAGREATDDDDHEAAKAAFGDAESAFERATETFDAGKDSAPTALVPSFETALCQSGSLETAASAFEDAAGAAADGDFMTAQQRQDDAEDALEDADSCAEE